MNIYKIGWGVIAFVLWLFIFVVLMHGCTPYGPKAEAQEKDKLPFGVAEDTRVPFDIWYRQQMTCQYEILYLRHTTLAQGKVAINELATQGYRVVFVDWEKSGEIFQGFYTMERCE